MRRRSLVGGGGVLRAGVPLRRSGSSRVRGLRTEGGGSIAAVLGLSPPWSILPTWSTLVTSVGGSSPEGGSRFPSVHLFASARQHRARARGASRAYPSPGRTAAAR